MERIYAALYLAGVPVDMYLGTIAFLLSSVLVGGLWWAARRGGPARRFWSLLAAGWTLNWLGDLAWGVYYVLVSPGYPGWVDVFYLGRYLLVLLALWSCPIAWSRRRGLSLLVVALLTVTLMAILAGGWILAQPAGVATSVSWWYVVGGMGYPTLDVVLLCAAWLCWRGLPASPLCQALAWLIPALLAYGAANWINYGVRVMSPEARPDLPSLLWLLSTVFVGLAVWRFLRHTRPA